MLAWIAFADLVLIVILGSVLVARWSKDRRGAGAPGAPHGRPHLPSWPSRASP